MVNDVPLGNKIGVMDDAPPPEVSPIMVPKSFILKMVASEFAALKVNGEVKSAQFKSL